MVNGYDLPVGLHVVVMAEQSVTTLLKNVTERRFP